MANLLLDVMIDNIDKGRMSVHEFVAHANQDSCKVAFHIPADAPTGQYKVSAVKVAPMSGVYKPLAMNGETPTFEIKDGSVVMPQPASVAVIQ
jgi:hypothetical protein